MKRVLVMLTMLLSLSAATQPRRYRYYRSISASSGKLTVRQAGSGTRPLMFDGGWQKSSASCTASITSGGTVSGGSTISGASIPLLDDRSPLATAIITVDGTVSGDTTVVQESASTAIYYDGGLRFSAGATPTQFTMAWSCSGTQTLEQYLQFNEE